MKIAQKITPCLWIDHQAEEAADFYTTVFENSRILAVSRYGEAGQEVHGRPPGSAMSVAFELDGQPFTALNGGPAFRLNEAISFQVFCETQAEVDYFWDRLSAGGDERAQQCGWLKDRFGVSWQIVPTGLLAMIQDPDPQRSQRAFAAMLGMKRLDLAALERAFAGDAEPGARSVGVSPTAAPPPQPPPNPGSGPSAASGADARPPDGAES
jgi:predicted 3-demethylubiquinone-9 3-methyltransferase (glyoxalase superfamily)